MQLFRKLTLRDFAYVRSGFGRGHRVALAAKRTARVVRPSARDDYPLDARRSPLGPLGVRPSSLDARSARRS
jgi:hypothetical protein